MKGKSKRWVFPVLGAVVVVVLAVVLLVGRKPGGGGNGPRKMAGTGTVVKLDQAAIDAAIPPMPGLTGERKGWADKLRGVYAALPEPAKREMLTKGEYHFKLSDLSPEQASTIKEFVEKQNPGTDPSSLTYGFGHALPYDPDHVRFFMQRQDGGRAQPEIGLWPGGKSK